MVKSLNETYSFISLVEVDTTEELLKKTTAWAGGFFLIK